MEYITHLLKTNVFVRNSAILFGGTMVINVLNYIFHLAIGRTVTPEMYGEIESLIALLTIISVPAAALTMIATKYAATLKAEDDVLGTKKLVHYLNRKIFFFGLPVFGGALLLTPLIQNFLRIDVALPIIFLWLTMFLSFLSAITIGALTGWQKFGMVNEAGISMTLLKLVGALLCIQLGFGVSGVVGAIAFSVFAGYFVSLYALKRFSRRTGKAESEKREQSWANFSVRDYVLPALLGTLATAILGNIDMVFAKHHLDAAVSGEYGALSVAAKTIFFVTGVVTTVLFAMAAEKGEDIRSSLSTFFFALKLILLVVTLSILFFFFFPAFVLSLLFGSTYVGVSASLVWFALAAGLYSLSTLILQYLLSLHETRAAILFLALSSLQIVTLYLFGETLHAIIGITIATQVLAVFGGGMFVVYRMQYAQKDLSRHTSL